MGVVSRVGVLGGGQLGRMLALAGYPLGLEFLFLDPSPDACAAALGQHLCADYSDPGALARLCASAQVVTFEFENVPLAVAERVAARLPLHPGPLALRTGQDRLAEKKLFQRLKIPVPPFRPVDRREALDAALEAIGLPALLKTRRLGYDGKGQAVLHQREDLDQAWQAVRGQPSILERKVIFERELSCLAVRAGDGAVRYYQVVENTHRGGILRRSLPRADDPLQRRAEEYTGRVLEALSYVGVLAFEFFVVDGELLGNEIAPRVHNSGHWSIEGAETSQFENHLRAITGLPLGNTATRSVCAMFNCIDEAPPLAALAALAGVHPHLYGKLPKPGRKLGHITVTAADPAELEQRLTNLKAVAPELFP
ncbi:MAG: 5-(carboxyamino)imidazole ribonucleotide synthase [Gammaproteobacteria bacterium]|nr:5-(carboxyamino)imidazole ribonucleotide synthase [Gammaproteobacteria bacterium]